MHFNRLETAEVSHKTALVRVDFNVPVNAEGEITDDTRLRAALPTIEHLRQSGAKTVLLAHFGRPKGQVDPNYSLEFLVPTLSKLIGDDIVFSAKIDKSIVDALPTGGVLLLENTRFHEGETNSSDELSQAYASLGDIFVADAFSVAHRDHASSAGIARFLPAYAGLAMERELDHIAQALDVPTRPVMGIVGGAKVSTKIDLLKNLVSKLDCLVIGGGMANTFLYAQGHNVGKSLCETDYKATALDIVERARDANCKILLPVDVTVAKAFEANAEHRVCAIDAVAADEMILDVGPDTVNTIADAMDGIKTLVWNGPLGAFELTPFDTSTVEAAKYAAKLTSSGQIVSVAGGGDTVAALQHAGVKDKFTFISTAGGAFLEWMEGKVLPGVDILKSQSD